MVFDKERWDKEVWRALHNHVAGTNQQGRILALLERVYAEGKSTDWDREQKFKAHLDESGLECIARWVREYKANLDKRGNGMFDSTLQCISEGGEVFYVDPEEIERTIDALAVARKEVEKVLSESIVTPTPKGGIVSGGIIHEVNCAMTHGDWCNCVHRSAMQHLAKALEALKKITQESGLALGEWRCNCTPEPGFDKSVNQYFMKACLKCGAERP